MNPDIQGLASVGYVNFLFGIFLAYWARTVGRSRLLWLLFGWVLAPIAGLVMLFLHKPASTQAISSRKTNDVGRADLLSTRKDVI